MVTRPAREVEFLGIRFDVVDHQSALAWVAELSRKPSFAYVVTPNVDHVVRLHEVRAVDQALWDAYRGADAAICDSRVLARLATWSGIRLPAVPGSDLTAALVRIPMLKGRTVHVIGGDPDMVAVLRQDYPHLFWRQHTPPLGVLHNPEAQAAIVASVLETRADIVLFAIGSPQSELICARLKATGAARGVALCIGASIEFLAGRKRRAPRIWQRLGLEWLFRLACEPRRLWRRYLVKGPKIFLLWARHHHAGRQTIWGG